jgi:hypothetical protein
MDDPQADPVTPQRTTATTAILREGPAGGHEVWDDRPVIWVAVLDGDVHVLPDRQAEASMDVLRRAAGKWLKYKRGIHGNTPAYEWVENPAKE